MQLTKTGILRLILRGVFVTGIRFKWQHRCYAQFNFCLIIAQSMAVFTLFLLYGALSEAEGRNHCIRKPTGISSLNFISPGCVKAFPDDRLVVEY